jgi:hypothetical protein
MILTGCAASDANTSRAKAKPEIPEQVAIGVHVDYSGFADLVNDFSAAGASVFNRNGGDVIEIAYHTDGRMAQNNTRMFEDICGRFQGGSRIGEIEHGPKTSLDSRSGRKIDFTEIFESAIAESMPAEVESDKRNLVTRSYKEVVICPNRVGVKAFYLDKEIRALIPHFASYERCELTDDTSKGEMLCHWLIFQPTLSWAISHSSSIKN